MKKKGFTLLEFVVVVILISIILGGSLSYLTTRQADKFYVESCVNAFYGLLSEHIYKASTSTAVKGNNNEDFVPSFYSFGAWNGGGARSNITTGTTMYINAWSPGTSMTDYTELYSTGISYCFNEKTYDTEFEYNFRSVLMKPGFYDDGISPGITMDKIEGNNIPFDEEGLAIVLVKYCRKGESCAEFGKIIFDARTGILKKSFCKTYEKDDESKCEEWTTGNN